MSMELVEGVELAGAVAGGFAGRLEVLEGPTGRRRWPDDVKARIVAESFRPGVLVSAVAQRHGISPQQLTTWRRAARDGHLALPGEADGPGFVPLVVDGKAVDLADERPVEAKPTPETGAVIEVEVVGLVVRLPAEMAAARIAAVVSALKALA
ncbi:IS66-like element accessory protein TnpA [Aquibaculum arenosum]|uniref:Transposase n=1 Tax=Aquibaculum arenosum TaxID=3032591 RepID=A0ABT5YRB8_9PROT|nr:transposase [Fodinicurvata sp. CAU 1616]MDF2097528.1 transposase [Fodinicurvata sp. CAU 1616]